MYHASLLEPFKPPMVDGPNFAQYCDAQDRVPAVCEAIGARVKAGLRPSEAIAAELRERFPERKRLDQVERYVLAFVQTMAAEYMRSPDAR